MKVFNVPIEAMCTVVVLAESEDQAREIATGTVDYGDFEMTTGGPAEEIKSGDFDDDDDDARSSYIRHADIIYDNHGRQLKRKDALALIAS